MKIIDSEGGDNLTKSEKQSLGILGLTLVLASFYILGAKAPSYEEEVNFRANRIFDRANDRQQNRRIF
jgi:hypothetical protein